LPIIGIKYLTELFNAVLLKGYFPAQWKITQIILILKLGKPPNELTSYRPIRVFYVVSEVFERLLLKRILLLVHRINEALENEQYCSAAFLDISQAFDKAWHTGFLHKLNRSLPVNYFLVPKCHLHSGHFPLKVKTEYTELSLVNAGVPQSSVLEPSLYLLGTADLPTSPESTTATFSHDTAVIQPLLHTNCKPT
jgi:hypothetical protein